MSRAKAPNVRVGAVHIDRRAQLMAKLNEEHPEYVHVFRDSSTPVLELELTGQEFVRNNTYNKEGDGDVMKWRKDSIARIKRDDYEALREQASEESASSVKEVYAGDVENEWKQSDLGRKVAKAKDPKKLGKPGGE
jgi:hypothetical protein